VVLLVAILTSLTVLLVRRWVADVSAGGQSAGRLIGAGIGLAFGAFLAGSWLVRLGQWWLAARAGGLTLGNCVPSPRRGAYRTGMAELASVNLAVPRPNPAKGVGITGIDKRPVKGAVPVRAPGPKGAGFGSGLVGDQIFDRAHHGGDDQAVYAYAREDLSGR
jgi:hypothetical protein